MNSNGCRIGDSTYSMNNDLSTLLYSMLSMYTYMDKHKTQTTTSEKKEHATHMRAIIYDGVITLIDSGKPGMRKNAK